MPETAPRHPVVELTRVRLLEYLREPEVIFWVFAFPVLMALALGVAFRVSTAPDVPVGVLAGPGADRIVERLDAADGLEAEAVQPADAVGALRDGAVHLVVVPGDPPTYRYDPTRPESLAARFAVDDALQRAAGRGDLWEARHERVVTPGSRYIDWLIPGLLGMNVMGTGMWGIGFAVVQARTLKLLKRLVATPMQRRHYLVSHILARLAFLGLEVGLLLGFAWLVFDVPVQGSLVSLAAVTVLGAMTFAGIGLLVASRAQTIEAVSGLMNVTMVPMWVLSGVFFSSEQFPAVVQPLITALPLTALNDALRGIMIDGVSLGALASPLGILAAWGIGSFGVAIRIFRWQ